MHKQLVTTVVGVILAVGVASAQQPTPKPHSLLVKPHVTVEHSQLDVGEVLAGRKVVATFVFHNSGPKPVKILKAAPS